MRALRIGRAGRALIVAPHPDDEAIGAWALIGRLVAGGWHVRVLIVTDGAGSHRGSARWPTRRLVAARARESRKAMARIGVAAGRVRFLGLPDGAVGSGDTAAIARAVRHARATLLVGPDPADAHPDHRATAAAMAGARTPGARRLRYPVWGAPARGAWHGIALGARRGQKRAAILRYRTQTGAIRDDPAGFAIARHELAAFSRPVERFR